MKKIDILEKMNKTFNKVSFSTKKHSPEILIVVGVLGTVTAAVMACKATTKINDILEETKKDTETINKCAKNENRDYSEEDKKRDLTLVYIQTGIKFVKLYAPAVTVGTFSIISILASNDILRKRNVALAAAYTTVDKSFKEYRNRVKDRFGKEVEKELRYNIKAKEVEELVIDENTGDTQKTVKSVNTVGVDGYSDYARFFDGSSYYWEKSTEHNLMFLRQMQSYANDLLKVKGHLFLNDVYKMLDIPETKAGQIVGWTYNPDNPNSANYIDFGIYEINREANRDFVNGYEPVILLDFNVDGNIWDLM